MKSRFLLVLPLAGLLALPAIAQDNNQQPQSSNPPAATDQQSTAGQAQPQSDQATTSSRQPLTYERHEGFWGRINPFARKKYVQRQLTPIRDRMNELDELTTKNAAAIRDVDSRATEGIKQADNRASLADQHAIDAGNKATQAQQTAQAADVKLTNVNNVVTNIDQYKPATQVEIKFRPGQAVLSQNAKSALDDLAGNLKGQHGFIIEVQGFSAGRGIGAVQNSQKMADAVVRYLVINHEIPVYRIYTLGLGNAPVQASADGTKPRRTTGGRVEVSLLKNEGLSGMQSAVNAAPSASPNDGQAQTQPSSAQPSGSLPQGDQTAAPASNAPAAQPTEQPQQQPPAAQPAPPTGKQQTPPPTPHQ
jgi:outer membrane protein OmpA-like peptidoglycan-associated protein